MNKKINLLTLLSSVCLLASCNNYKAHGDYDGLGLHYVSSDEELDTFLNDFTHRNMRYDADMAGIYEVGHGTGFAKNWETMAISFQNSSKEVYREDKFAKIVDHLTTITQDDLGMIYNTHHCFDEYYSKGYDGGGYSMPQGWPFPSWLNARENPIDVGSDNFESSGTITFEFNDSWYDMSKNWKAENGIIDLEDIDLDWYAKFNSNGSIPVGSTYKFYKDDIGSILADRGGISTVYAPFVDIDIEYTGENVKDFNLIFKTTTGGDTWFRAPLKTYATVSKENKSGWYRERTFMPMYLNEDWNQKIVTAIGVEFVGQDGKSLKVSDGKVNYIRPTYDTRQSNATYQWILSLYNYFIFTRDISVLKDLMPKARKALLFLTHCLEGEKGLLDLSYIYGHDGVTIYSDPSRPYDRLAYHGIGNGWWDVTPTSRIGLESNCYYYQAVKDMAVLEEALEKNKITLNPEDCHIRNRDLTGEDVYYEYDSNSLKELANLVKESFERPIDPREYEDTRTYTAGDYHYENFGGFYNPKTGRFAGGINEFNGKIADYGYLYLNLEAVAAGLGSKEQQKSIMDWIDGNRVVDGDNAKGKDEIYFYEFAPLANTKDCSDGLSFTAREALWELDEEGLNSFHRQVQNGGAAITWSYYDLVARYKVFGAENAYNRLNEIKNWYNKVLKESRGKGTEFYGDYYDRLEDKNSREHPEQVHYYDLQAASTRGPGAIGLDAEFIESVVFIRAIPEIMFGMDATDYNNLTFTYSKPEKLKVFEEYNLKYGEACYSISERKNTIEIFGIRGLIDKDFTITFKYKTDENIKINLNGQPYKEPILHKDGYVSITVPFDNCMVEFDV